MLDSVTIASCPKLCRLNLSEPTRRYPENRCAVLHAHRAPIEEGDLMTKNKVFLCSRLYLS